MKIHVPSTLSDAPELTGTAVTIGNFDGVHRGHRAVISRLCDAARERGLESVVVTFQPHHRLFFAPESEPFLLTDVDEKLSLLAGTGADQAVVLPFDAELSSLTAAEFIRRVLAERFGTKMLLLGHDQAIGSDQLRGEGALSSVVRDHEIELASMEPLSGRVGRISSTMIRSLVKEGSLDEAVDALGAPYQVTGSVIRGQGEGRSLGYPTANIAVADRHKLVPSDGIYAATVEILRLDEEADGSPGTDVPVLSAGGMLYVGSRPTLYDNGALAIEVSLLDFEGDLYGSRLRLHVLKRLRGDQKFDSREELSAQIRRDEEATRRLLPQKPRVPVDGADAHG